MNPSSIVAWLFVAVLMLALAFILASVITAVWKSVHNEELLRLRRFRDDIAFESAISEAGISSERLQSMIEQHGVAR